MKKILLTLALVIAGMTLAKAQLLQPGLQISQSQAQTAAPKKTSPMRALGQNQLYMGSYFTDELGTAGLGLAGYDEVLKVATVLTLDKVQQYDGGVVKAIRFGLFVPVSDAAVYLWPITSLNPLTLGEPLIEQEVASTAPGWNEVQINEPCTLNLDGLQGLMMGYQYHQLANSGNNSYPILAVMAGNDICPSFIYGQLGQQSTAWYDVGMANYGNLCIQAIVENENFPSYDLKMKNLVIGDYVRVSNGIKFNVTLSNFGIKTLENYIINAYVDGQLIDQIDSPLGLTPTEMIVEATCPLDGVDLTVGKHTFALQVANVDGEDIEDGTKLEAQFTAYHEAFPRQKNLVEQFTSQYCTYCPLGERFIQAVADRCGNLAWVGLHYDMSGEDEFHNTRGDQIMSYLNVESSFPQATFNRFDYERAGVLAFGIGFSTSTIPMYADYLMDTYINDNWTPVVASIGLSGTYDKQTRELKLMVEGETTSELKTLFGSGVGITVYLTEDSLIAKQLNQGTWVNDFCHNHVMRDVISTVSGSALQMVEGTLSYANEFTTTLNEQWNSDNMNVVALVNRKGSGTKKEVFNCETIAIKDLPEPGVVILGDVTGDGQVDIADVNAVINIMLQKNPASDYPGNADITGDDDIDIADVNAIINIMLDK